MRARRGVTLLEIIAVLVLLTVVVWMIATPMRQASRARGCHDAGYPDVRMPGAFQPWAGSVYCVKRVNQTDVVVRLDSLRGRK